jgi:hypothetical protein
MRGYRYVFQQANGATIDVHSTYEDAADRQRNGSTVYQQCSGWPDL